MLAAGSGSAITGHGDSNLFSLNTSWLSATPDEVLPRAHALLPCRPNPFNPTTTIVYELPQPSRVHLAIYDARGRRVRLLQEGQPMLAGRHEISWDGRGNGGQPVAGGVYLCRLQADGFQGMIRMVLVK